MYSYSIFVPDQEITSSKGFGKVSHVPSIFDGQARYNRTGSRYLIDRVLGVWPRHNRQYKYTDQTLLNYAEWLKNFLEWAEVRNIDILKCGYIEHIEGRYQKEMIAGLWSRNGKGLNSGTINARIDIACDFLTWLEHKGIRSIFDIPTKPQNRYQNEARLYAKNEKSKQSRDGRLGLNPTHIHMPSDLEIKNWLKEVNDKYGYTKTLLCETILLTAIRRSEATCLRTDFIPESPSDWVIINPTAPEQKKLIQVSIRYGTKGRDYGKDNDDKIGPSRSISVPLHLAYRLHEYRQKQRSIVLRKWIRSTSSRSEQIKRINSSVHLFLDDTGCRISSKGLYNVWTGVTLPFKGWSPHKGRHWWVCSVIWREITRSRINGQNQSETEVGIRIENIIRLYIKPQLGHISEETTMRYTQWATSMLSEALPELYQEKLDSFI